jgi:amino acid transporter
VMVGIGTARWIQHPAPIWQPFSPPGHPVSHTFSMGLYVVLWNYLGWEGLSTINGEVERPSQTFPRALRFAVPLVTLAYLLPVAAGLVGMPDWRKWGESSLPQVAAAVGGAGLGLWVAVTGLVSSAGLYSANLLANSRLPFVMAGDGCLPQALTRTHPKFGTPWAAILLSAAIYSVFTLNAFSSLVVVDVILYSAVLLLELAALVVLRVKRPGMPRPFRVPGGWPGLALVVTSPVALLALAIVSRAHEEGFRALALSLAALATGPVLYPVLRRFLKKDPPDAAVPIEPEMTAPSE